MWVKPKSHRNGIIWLVGAKWRQRSPKDKEDRELQESLVTISQSVTQFWTCCLPCIGRRILNHCATKEAPVTLILESFSCVFNAEPPERGLIAPTVVFQSLRQSAVETVAGARSQLVESRSGECSCWEGSQRGAACGRRPFSGGPPLEREPSAWNTKWVFLTAYSLIQSWNIAWMFLNHLQGLVSHPQRD